MKQKMKKKSCERMKTGIENKKSRGEEETINHIWTISKFSLKLIVNRKLNFLHSFFFWLFAQVTLGINLFEKSTLFPVTYMLLRIFFCKNSFPEFVGEPCFNFSLDCFACNILLLLTLSLIIDILRIN